MSKETKKNRKFYHFFGVHSRSNEGRIEPAEFLVVCIDFLINVANFLLLAGQIEVYFNILTKAKKSSRTKQENGKNDQLVTKKLAIIHDFIS